MKYDGRRQILDDMQREIPAGQIAAAAAWAMASLAGRKKAGVGYTGKEVEAWINKLNSKQLQALRRIAERMGH